ncbi:transposase [Ectothiorhodospiraceae bacterium WFHF3C12]|nr:transposase [Ectothiorhodospiraceae bacterium WFHF3C12]
MRYRRARTPGARYFFTVVTHQRRPVLTNGRVRALVGAALRATRRTQPFSMDAVVLLPDHLHCIWTLPADDADFSTRWRRIKRFVTLRAGAGHIWQGRFWEHLIRDDADWRAHVDYVHYNPVKHGLAAMPGEWPYSSFHRFVAEGVYPADWGRSEPPLPATVGRE